MRSILEKAIVHLLNEDTDKAEALFHKFMVEKARKIHESLRTGDTVLAEGWDDEITSEEYMTEDDLESVEDKEDDEHADDTAELSDDLGTEEDEDEDEMADKEAEDADAEDEDTDMEIEDHEDGVEDEEVTTEERIDDLETQIEELTAEFDRMMAEIDGTDEDEFGDLDDDSSNDNDTKDMEDVSDDMSDEVDDEDMDDMADHMEDTVTTDDDDMVDESMMDETDGMMEGKMPPQLAKYLKKKEMKKDGKKEKKEMKEDVSADEEDDDLDDITESVMAELEKISVSLDGHKEVGAGTGMQQKLSPNDKSPIPMVNVDKRGGAMPVKMGGPGAHSGFERETAPGVKDMPKKKNTVKGKVDSVLSKVTMDKNAALNKDYAGSSNKKSAID